MADFEENIDLDELAGVHKICEPEQFPGGNFPYPSFLGNHHCSSIMDLMRHSHFGEGGR